MEEPADPDRPAFTAVSKESFREIYFRLGAAPYSGWTADYWQKFFEEEVHADWTFMVEQPRSPAHDQMWIVSDTQARQYRLFFLRDDGA